MSWREHHRRSEQFAILAEARARLDDVERSKILFREAAEAEQQAIADLAPDKERTLGVSAVSAVSLLYRADDLEDACQLAHRYLGGGMLPEFAIQQLQTLLQEMWASQSRSLVTLERAEDPIHIGIRGGQVIEGGAPITWVVERVATMRRLLLRSAEELRGLPHRFAGPPLREIRDDMHAWMLQAAPGSYQFSIVVQRSEDWNAFPASQIVLDDDEKPVVIDRAQESITDHALAIIEAGHNLDQERLRELVSESQYRVTFLKLLHELSPKADTFDEIVIQGGDGVRKAYFDFDSERALDEMLEEELRLIEPSRSRIRGKLSALHLDQDWLEVSDRGKRTRVWGVLREDLGLLKALLGTDVSVDAVVDQNGRRLYADISSQALAPVRRQWPT